MRSLTSPLCLLVAISAGSVGAAPRKAEVEVQAIHRAPEPAAASDRARPALSAEQFRRQVRRMVSRLTKEAIAVLKRLLATMKPDDPDRADPLFRLAEQYRELKTDAMFQARALDEPIFRATGGAREALRARQRLQERRERAWLDSALRAYLHVAANDAFRGYARMDEVLFNIADLLGQLGRRDQALQFFRRLIRNHPTSANIPDAYLSFAEHYFNAGQIAEALKLYEQVGRFPGSPLHDYALYKQGWCWLNLKDPHRALEKFVQVIRHGTRRPDRITLVREAQKDAVRAYSQVGVPARAWDFFRRIAGPRAAATRALRMLERLAGLYLEQGKFLESILVHRKLMALSPEDRRLCDWQHAVVTATLSGKDKRQQLLELQRLAATSDLQPVKSSGQLRCRQHTAGLLQEMATTWHKECQVTRNLDTCRLARQLYEAYLQRFATSPTAYRLAYYHAELLYKLEDWPAAAGAYTRVVKMRPRGALLRDAALGAAVSCQNEMDASSRPINRGGAHEPVERGDPRRPQPIPATARRMLDAFATYLSYVPDGPERVNMLYRQARLLYTYDHHEEAIRGFARVATRYPGHELAEFAVQLLLDSLNILGHEPEMMRWIDRFLAIKELQRPTLVETLNRLKLELGWKAAQRLRKAGEYQRCAEQFVKLANAHPDEPRWPKMLQNAALCFEAAKLVGQAIAVRNTLIQGKPESPEAQRALYAVAQNYQALAWYSRAADHFERYARRFPGEPNAPDALQNAIVFHMGLGAYERASEAARLFAANYGNRSATRTQAAAVHFALGQIHDAHHDVPAAIRHYEDYLRRWGAMGGVQREIQAHVKLGALLWRQACPIQGADGLCLAVQRKRSQRGLTRRTTRSTTSRSETPLRARCGSDTRARQTLVRRNGGLARAALAHFERVLRLYARWPATVKSDSAEAAAQRDQLNAAVAEAEFHLAESRLEQVLAVAFPDRLDFSSGPRQVARSRARLMDYMRRKDQLLKEARALYQKVIQRQAPHWAIAAAARVGQLFQGFADALFTAPIPRPPIPRQLTTAAGRRDFLVTFQDTYCTELERYAIRLEDRAVEALGRCLDQATRLSWYNEWSSLCERELDQLRPGRSPMAAEIRAQPTFVRQRADRVQLIRALVQR